MRRYGPLMTTVEWLTGLTTLADAIPYFWLGIVLISEFALKHRIFPAVGMVDFTKDPMGALHSATLPAIALSLSGVAVIGRQLRGAAHGERRVADADLDGRERRRSHQVAVVALARQLLDATVIRQHVRVREEPLQLLEPRLDLGQSFEHGYRLPAGAVRRGLVRCGAALRC